MEPLTLFQDSKQRLFFLLLAVTVFVINTFIEYNSYKNFSKNEVLHLDTVILNVYPKKNYNVVKLKNEKFTFFTSISKELHLQQLQKLDLFIITQRISVIEYLQGFYTKSFNHNILDSKPTLKIKLSHFIDDQHHNKTVASLYNALFLAISIPPTLREFTSNYAIAHLIAISGFHIGIITALLYFILNLIYKPIHQKYYPYRNKRFDILIFVCGFLFAYLYLLDFVPSLLRAFVMFVFGIFLLRNNIKLFSFETLFIIVVFILALFPKLLFSLSLWFSVAGVFYIFLFIQYFKNFNRYFQILFFNLWIFLAINPIVHYFFPVTSYEQIFSPILTIIFTLFYPISAFLHLLTQGDYLDNLLLQFINSEIHSFNKTSSIEFLIVFLITSLGAIYSKTLFYILNFLIIIFTIYLFVFNDF